MVTITTPRPGDWSLFCFVFSDASGNATKKPLGLTALQGGSAPTRYARIFVRRVGSLYSVSGRHEVRVQDDWYAVFRDSMYWLAPGNSRHQFPQRYSERVERLVGSTWRRLSPVSYPRPHDYLLRQGWKIRLRGSHTVMDGVIATRPAISQTYTVR